MAQAVGNVGGAEAFDRAQEGAGVRRGREIVHAIVAIAGHVTPLGHVPALRSAVGDGEDEHLLVGRAEVDRQERGPDRGHGGVADIHVEVDLPIEVVLF